MLKKDDLGDVLNNLRGEDVFGFFMAADTVSWGTQGDPELLPLELLQILTG